MFLGLLCEHMRASGAFPSHSHSVFDSYFSRRLSRDQNRVQRRFGLNPEQLMETAETVAFGMTASQSIGLSPSRDRLKLALEALRFPLPDNFFDRLDALEFLKLARSESEAVYGGGRPFTFAHRRFQEYFATLRVLRDVRAVSPQRLLFDGRWRETAVVLLQTQTAAAAGEVLAAAQIALSDRTVQVDRSALAGGDIDWGPKLHVLGILQDGFSGRAENVPEALRAGAAVILQNAVEHGSLADRKLALEHAGILPGAVLEELINTAFTSGSRWLRETAFQQLARLVNVSWRIRDHVIVLLQQLLLDGKLRSERYFVRAQLQRLGDQPALLPVLRLYLAVPVVDMVLHLLCLAVVLIFLAGVGHIGYITLALPVTFVALSWATLRVRLAMWYVTILRITLLYVGMTLVFVSHAPAIFAVGHPVLSVFVVIVALGAFFWAPLSIAASRHARILHPVNWIFLPLMTLTKAIRGITLLGTAVAGGVVGAVGLLVALFTWVIRLLSADSKRMFMTSLGIVYGGMLLVLAIRWARSGLMFCRTRLTLYGLRTALSLEELLAVLDRHSTYGEKAAIVAHVRVNGLLRSDGESIRLVRGMVEGFATGAGSPGQFVAAVGGIERTRSRVIRKLRWILVQLVTAKDIGLPDFKDEIYRLRERLTMSAVTKEVMGEELERVVAGE